MTIEGAEGLAPGMGEWRVLLDGKREFGSPRKLDAQRYAAGLRAEVERGA